MGEHLANVPVECCALAQSRIHADAPIEPHYVLVSLAGRAADGRRDGDYFRLIVPASPEHPGSRIERHVIVDEGIAIAPDAYREGVRVNCLDVRAVLGLEAVDVVAVRDSQRPLVAEETEVPELAAQLVCRLGVASDPDLQERTALSEAVGTGGTGKRDGEADQDCGHEHAGHGWLLPCVWWTARRASGGPRSRRRTGLQGYDSPRPPYPR